MLGINGWEFIVLAILGILILGPDRMPEYAQKLAQLIFRIRKLAEGAKDLQALLGEHGFLPGVAGHASAGNLHFMLSPDFSKEEDLERYEAFMARLVELIVGRHDCSLTSVHGTVVNKAPFV